MNCVTLIEKGKEGNEKRDRECDAGSRKNHTVFFTYTISSDGISLMPCFSS